MNLTTEQQKDIETRTAEFLKRHETNVKELEIDFAMIPIPVQVMENVYATQVKAMPIDKKYSPKPSPYGNGAPQEESIIREL